MRTSSIESAANTRVKLWASLQTGKGRRETGLFLAEGPRVLATAAASGTHALALLLDASRYSEPPAGLPNADEAVLLSPAAMAKISAVENGQGMAAVYQIPVAPEFPAEGELLVLAAQGVQDPGNLGTMIRIAAACRCDLFAAVDDCADPWSPKVVRASAGLLFAMPVLATDSATLLRLCELSTVQAYAATGEDGTDHRTATVSARALLAIGSEGAGLSKVWTETAQKVTIRMWEGCESLNAAIAAGILTHAFASRLGRI